MIIIIILIVLAGVVYLIMNNASAQTTTMPNTNVSNTIITLPQITPFVNPIPNLILIKGDLDLFYKANGMSVGIDSESKLSSNLTWNKDINIIINSVDTDADRLAAQFRFFAEFWLNKLNINSGFTNVYDLSGNIGSYEFKRNDTIYTGKFNGIEWSWDTVNYCFNTVNSKRQNKCLGGWVYNKDNNKCYPPLNSTSTCDNYEHKIIYNYLNQTDVNNWMSKCNVFNTPNCAFPREGQLLKSPTTQPPATQPPTTQPPATQPPATQPPFTPPPATQPPATQPPFTPPPATQPPATQPPPPAPMPPPPAPLPPPPAPVPPPPAPLPPPAPARRIAQPTDANGRVYGVGPRSGNNCPFGHPQISCRSDGVWLEPVFDGEWIWYFDQSTQRYYHMNQIAATGERAPTQ